MLSPFFHVKGRRRAESGGDAGACAAFWKFRLHHRSKSRLTMDAQGLIQEFDELGLQ